MNHVGDHSEILHHSNDVNLREDPILASNLSMDSDATARSTSDEETIPEALRDNTKRKRQDRNQDELQIGQNESNAQNETPSKPKRKKGGQATFDKQEAQGTKQESEKAPVRRSKRKKADQEIYEPEHQVNELSSLENNQNIVPAQNIPSTSMVVKFSRSQLPMSSEQGQDGRIEALTPENYVDPPHQANDLEEGLENSKDSDQKYSPLQLKAWVLSGQPLNLPGYQWPGILPHVQMGSRWQLDLRTGERLEEPNSAHMNLNHLAALQGQHPNSYTMQNAALAAQTLGSRGPQFQGAQSQGYGVSGGMYQNPLNLPTLSQSLNGQGNSNNTWTAQMLAAQGLIAQHNQSSLAQMHNLPGLQHIASAARQSQRQRSQSQSQDMESLPDIPLRRRGRPAGENSGSASSPQQLVERRMQANRAAASRSHFRRKKEMESLEKDCALAEGRIQELRMALAAMIQQEEQLRMHQQTIRSQLNAGMKPDESLSLPSLLQHHIVMGETGDLQDFQQQMAMEAPV